MCSLFKQNKFSAALEGVYGLQHSHGFTNWIWGKRKKGRAGNKMEEEGRGWRVGKAGEGKICIRKHRIRP